MASTTSKTDATAKPTADAFRAFADFLSTNTDASAVGADGNFTDWWASDAGKAAAQAAADQAVTAAKASRLADCRALARDVRDNGQVTSYSKDRAARVLAYLQTVDFDAIKSDAS